ncbi:preprotein translocase subunit YajC [uncultured Oscillibacter sp.]|uniref:preprotein translocase subunit YajC n=1 Tax=uncultured Oscillibacter sp. TaxID=876091 RepID=UPI0025EFEBB7|nr:preprotein translocase subunit YajC [uncultured Oscillibacter sp.]
MNESSYSIIMLVVLMVVFYFLLIRPENKRKKKAQEMRESIKKGDTITTIGGIVGRVVMVNQDTLVIETSEDRVRMEITKWAISTTGVQASDQPANDKKKKKDEESPVVEKAVPVEEKPAEEEKKD